MVIKTNTSFSFFLVAAAFTTAGCGYNQQSRFQMSFLPPAPHAVTVEVAEPPALQPNLYLKTEIPAFLLNTPQLPPRRTQAFATIQRAERRFQAGKRSYQAKDIINARREFDAAIDAMLEASEQEPGDRQEFDRKLDEMVDAIHR